MEYPLALGTSDSAVRVSLENAFELMEQLYKEAGRDPADLQKAAFKIEGKHVPGAVMHMVSGVEYPTTSGMKRAEAGTVERAWGKGTFLVDAVPQETLAKYTYIDLDKRRFVWAAIAELVANKAIDENGKFTALARREVKKNCAPVIADEDSVDTKGKAAVAMVAPKAPPGKKAPLVQKNLRGLIDDEATSIWPHTPVTKSVTFVLESDPKQPKHKPLHRATLSLPLIKRSFPGEWMPNKRDAENSACSAALQFIHEKKMIPSFKW